MGRQNFSSGTAWEPLVGYSRAVRVGAHVYVSGTTATGADGEIVGRGDVEAQTRHTLENIAAVLEQAGAKLADVVRTRIYVADINAWRVIGQVHHEFFATIRPATSMIEVSRFVGPDILVEIEADAYIGDASEAGA